MYIKIIWIHPQQLSGKLEYLDQWCLHTRLRGPTYMNSLSVFMGEVTSMSKKMLKGHKTYYAVVIFCYLHTVMMSDIYVKHGQSSK